MAVPRRIVVDDTDPAIQYTPNQWFSGDVTQLNSLGNLGAVWNGTIHSTIVNGATLSFPFNGTSIDVIGTIQINTLSDGTPDPQWVCKVDEIEIANGTNPTFDFPENNWLLCNQDTLLAGPHNLTIKVQSKNTPFYFDSIQYIPTSDVSIDGAVLALDASDPAITYGPGWQFYTVENTQNITQTNGSHVTLNFHGTATTLTGYVPQELPHNGTTAEYSVDGGPATTFALAGLPANDNTTAFNVPMFSVSGLTPAAHNVVVTYLGDQQHTPLVVKTWYVTNSTTPAVAAPSPSSPSTSSPSHTTTSVAASKHTPTGAIAGGIVGALALIGLLAGLIFWLRRRQRWSDDTPNRPRNGEPRFALDTEARAGGAGASFVGGSVATGYATHGTGAGSSHATTQDPFDPYAENGTASGAGGSSSRSPFSNSAASPSSGGTTPYPYPYVAVPHGRTLSSEGASESSSSAQPQTSASPPSSSGGGGGAAPLVPRNGSLPPLAPQRTKSQEARMGQQQQRRVVVQRHQDSGVRLHGSTPSLLPEEVVVEELPPDYSRD